MNRTRHRRAAAVLAGFLLVPSAWAQEPAPAPEGASGEAESRHWIVLLDASLSSKRRDEEQSRELGKPDYRLRNEILALTQTLLASLRIKEQELQNDYLEVYVFGSEVRSIAELPDRPVDWDSVFTEEWWNERIPDDIGSRTNYFEAIRKAVDSFKSKHPEAEKRLVLISDGELDIGEINRRSRGALQDEELERYRNVLRPDSDLMSALTGRDVTVYTLALDDELYGSNDVARQKEIGRRLYETRFGGSTPLERALAVVESLAGRTRDGLLPYSEGPYVMRGLADQFGGEAHSVRYDNVLRVLWDTVFPTAQTRRIVVPPGTRQVIAFAPIDAPVVVKLRKDGEPQEVALRYDPERDVVNTDPPEAEVRSKVHPTSQYATWLIASDYLDEVHGLLGSQEEQISLVPVPNVYFDWRERQPPDRFLAGMPLEIGLDLVWQVEPPGKSVPEWRRLLRDSSIQAEAQVRPPGGDPRPVQLRAEIPPDTDTSAVVLKLSATYEATHADGSYQIEPFLVVGTPPNAWELKATPLRVQALAESPLSDPERFSLAVRPFQREGLGERTLIPPPTEEGEAKPVEVTVGRPPHVVFEWLTEPGTGCEGVEQLLLRFPDRERTLGSINNDLPGDQPVREDGRIVCYRSIVENLGTDAFEAPLTIEAADGLTEWRRLLRVEAPLPVWANVLIAIGAALLFLLLALLVALAVSEKLRRRLRRWWVTARAPFPLAAEWDGRRIEWAKGPKRLLIAFEPGGTVSAGFTAQSPPDGAPAVEVSNHSNLDFRIRLLSGSGSPPILRKVGGSGTSSTPRPLNSAGELVSRTELIRGTRLEIAHGDAKVTVLHRQR
jgi:hypothetical protein